MASSAVFLFLLFQLVCFTSCQQRGSRFEVAEKLDLPEGLNCGNLLTCLPHFLNLPLDGMVEAFTRYGSSLMLLANQTDEVLLKDVGVLVDSCTVWTAFSSCMGPSWVRCFDLKKMMNLANVVGHMGAIKEARHESTQAVVSQIDEDWETDSREVSIGKDDFITEEGLRGNKIDEDLILQASYGIDSLCKESTKLREHTLCLRDAFFSNETFTNITIRMRALQRSHCLPLMYECPEFLHVAKVIGYYVHKSCPEMVDILEPILTMLVNTDVKLKDDTCVEFRQAISLKSLNELPTVENYDFNANWSDPNCIQENITFYYTKFYEKYVTPLVPTMIEKYAWERNNYFDSYGFHPEVYLPTTKRIQLQTTKDPSIGLPRNSPIVCDDYEDGNCAEAASSQEGNKANEERRFLVLWISILIRF